MTRRVPATLTTAGSEAPPSAARSLLQDYTPIPGCYDEFLAEDGQPREHWRDLASSLERLGPEEFSRRWGDARELIRENGVTYNVYGDPQGMDRPWQLDPLPLLITAEESALVDAGLVQRGRLLEMILADLYGPQRLVRDGLLPADFLFANPGFLRPCHGLTLPGNRYLHFHAVDLGRTPDGRICVLRDRTQAPTGAGYALENRLVMARLLPEAFRDCRVQRLALFFRTFRDTLRGLAPRNRDNPRVVLLTPGPYNEAYFEHAYLARYLGYTLVEGGDLTVRDGRVMLKLLGGLAPVDVIVRRLSDDYCDPLELRTDSFLGVPGLVHAVRSGNVTVANALGCGLIEGVALNAYLPALCRHLLGEDLRLPPVPVWWCGEPAGLTYVLEHLPRLVIKPAFGTLPRPEPIFAERLSSNERQKLADRIRARPCDFVGQEQVALSTVPVLAGQRAEPRHLVTRAFLAARDEDDFAVMPGGLTRLTPSADSLIATIQRGGGSKDTWVLAAGAVTEISLLPPAGRPVELTRAGNDLPSRTADNLFWLGRYAERADGHVRLLRGVLVRITEKSGIGEVPELPALMRALTIMTRTLPGFVGHGADARLAAPTAELVSVMFDPNRAGSLAHTIDGLHRVAGTVRDLISLDMWRVVSSLELSEPEEIPGVNGHRAHGPNGVPRTLSDMLDRLDEMVITLAAFGGLANESMTRGMTWRFLDMGRRLERAMHTVSLLKTMLAPPAVHEGAVLEAVLEVADCLMTYRRRYLGSLQPAPVLDLLLADETNPRSLASQLAAVADNVDALPRDPPLPSRSPEQRLALAAVTALRLADIDRVAHPDAHGGRPLLAGLLGRLEADLPELSDTITRRFLSHLQPSRQLASPAGERAP